MGGMGSTRPLVATTIFILDGDHAHRAKLMEALGREGFECHPFENPMALLKASVVEPPRVVLTDLHLQGASGTALVRNLRAQRWSGGTTILAMVSHGHAEDVLSGFEAGVDDYVIKPAHAPSVLGQIRAQTKLRRRETVDATRLGKFTDLVKISQGAMGTIYRAYQQDIERHVALKVIKPALGSVREVALRFVSEGLLLRDLAHPHIVRVHDVGQVGSRLFVSMELLEGRIYYIIEDVIGFREALAILTAMADAMATYSDLNIVHRDIKPDNIMIVKRRGPVLIDFGLARQLETPHITAQGRVVGTPLYMAPEQVHGSPDIDIRADIYSLGQSLFVLLAGEHPYLHEDPLVTVTCHVTQEMPSLADFRPDLPVPLVALVDRMVKRDRDARIRTAPELLREVRRLSRDFTQRGFSPF